MSGNRSYLQLTVQRAAALTLHAVQPRKGREVKFATALEVPLHILSRREGFFFPCELPDFRAQVP